MAGSLLHGWQLDTEASAVCPDCLEPIGPEQDFAALVDAVEDHAARCDPDE